MSVPLYYYIRILELQDRRIGFGLFNFWKAVPRVEFVITSHAEC